MSADGEINNGGFDQLFANGGSGAVREAAAAAERIDSPVHARLLRSALAHQENSALARLDERWYSEERVLERRLRAYVYAHGEQFFSDG